MPLTKARLSFVNIIALLFFYASAIGQVNFSSSNIPILLIETNGQTILDDTRIVANLKVINNDTQRNFVSDTTYEYNGQISIEIRGSTSQIFPKKQFGLETQKEDGSNNNVSLIGLPIENDWILYAPFSDKTLIRNMLVYKLSGDLGHYAPRTRPCEVVLNGEYVGVYVLTEKIKRDKNRVDISKLNPDEISGDDLTGGYIIKLIRKRVTQGQFGIQKREELTSNMSIQSMMKLL